MTKSEKSFITPCSWDDENCRENIQETSSLQESYWLWNFKLSLLNKLVNYYDWTSNKHITCSTKKISLSCSDNAYFNSLKWELKIDVYWELKRIDSCSSYACSPLWNNGAQRLPDGTWSPDACLPSRKWVYM